MRQGKRKLLIRSGMLLSLLGGLWISTAGHAGQTQWVKKDGTTVTWHKGTPIKYKTDSVAAADSSSDGGGGGGCILNKAQAQDTPADKLTTAEFEDMVAKAFKVWTDAVGGDLVVEHAGSLGVDVDFSNVESQLFGTGTYHDITTGSDVASTFNLDACLNDDAAACPDGNNRVVFDPHGEIIDAIFGDCVRYSRHGATATYPKLDADGFPTSDIKHAEMIINGTCLTPSDLPSVPATVNVASCPTSSCKEEFTKTLFQGVVTHEAGHFLGLDHTLTNKENYLACTKSPPDASCIKENIPTMIGLPVPGVNLHTPFYDDIATIRKYYNNNALNEAAGSPFCTIKGTAYTSTGRTSAVPANENRCFEVVVRKADDDGMAASMVSGAEAPRTTNTGATTDCNHAVAGCGNFTIRGLEPGQTYYLGIHNFSGGNLSSFDIEPCDPAVTSGGTAADSYHSIANISSPPFDDTDFAKVTCPAGGGAVAASQKVFSN